MNETYAKLKRCFDTIREKTDFQPKVALTLGSGLGKFAEKIDVVKTVPYSEIDGFPISTAPGHTGRFVFGYSDGVPVVIMQGRVHYYEGYKIQDVVLPTRLMGMLGAEKLILTNASGGINRSFSPGDLMIITGHISSFVPSPLVGQNISELGVRFPDMSCVYDKELIKAIERSAAKLLIPIKHGVYIQTTGPNYETPEEIRMYGILGADAVGMSTTCEAIAARHMGMKVCGIICISNYAAGITNNTLSEQEVIDTANKISFEFEGLVKGVISEIGK